MSNATPTTYRTTLNDMALGAATGLLMALFSLLATTMLLIGLTVAINLTGDMFGGPGAGELFLIRHRGAGTVVATALHALIAWQIGLTTHMLVFSPTYRPRTLVAVIGAAFAVGCVVLILFVQPLTSGPLVEAALITLACVIGTWHGITRPT